MLFILTLGVAWCARSDMEKDDVVKKLKLGEFTTKPFGGKSAIWDHHVRIYDDKDEAIQFVECKTCKSVHYQDSHSTGTSKVKQHTEKCTQSSRSSYLTNHFEPTGETKPSASEKVDLTASLVGLCTTDMRPFNIVTGDGFKSVIQSVYSLGYKHAANGSTKQNIIEQLPCRTTVSNRFAAKNFQRIWCLLFLWYSHGSPSYRKSLNRPQRILQFQNNSKKQFLRVSRQSFT